jgi:hypothetical protein
LLHLAEVGTEKAGRSLPERTWLVGHQKFDTADRIAAARELACAQ